MTALDFPNTSARTGPAEAPPVVDTPEARDELECPLCRYSLRGLSAAEIEPRCPECGYRFTWTELLRARQCRHAYLFEQHGTFKSFLRTLRGALRPRRFWSSLNAGNAIHLPRLLRLAVISAVLVALSGTAGLFGAKVLTYAGHKGRAQSYVWFTRGPGGGSATQEVFRQAVDALRDPTSLYTLLLVVCLAWPWLTLVVLLIFQTSMRRAQIRPAHVLRCVLYSAAAFLWCGVVLLAAAGLRWVRVLPEEPYYVWGGSGTLEPAEALEAAGCVAVVLGLATFHLATAYRRYLRFEHAWGTVLASQVIFVLVVVTFVSLFYPQFYRFFT